MPFKALLRRRRSRIWEKKIDVAAREIRPLVSVEEETFPYSTLETPTRDFLKKIKGSVSEQDQALRKLIERSSNKLIAFTSCAAYLSENGRSSVLATAFPVDAESLSGLEPYLQAVIAASHNDVSTAGTDQRNFAAGLLPVARCYSVHRGLPPDIIVKLFSAWNDCTSPDHLLLSRARWLSIRVFRRIAVALRPGDGRSWWEIARRYKGAFDVLLPVQLNKDLVSCLDKGLPEWRCWVSWRPGRRVQTWSNATLRAPLALLCRLDGPALGTSMHMCATLRDALVCERSLHSWLEENRFRSDLFDNNIYEGVTYLEDFLSILEQALQQGDPWPALLKLLIDEYGIGHQSSAAYRLAHLDIPQSILLSVIFDSNRQQLTDEMLLKALQVISLPHMAQLRPIVTNRLVACIIHAAETAKAIFEQQFDRHRMWSTSALRLWTLRTAASRHKWLGSGIAVPLLDVTPFPEMSRVVVQARALYDAVKDRVRAKDTPEERLRQSVGTYIKSVVLDGKAAQNRERSLPAMLHSTWMLCDREIVRRAAITLACLESFDLEPKLDCIMRLRDIPENVAETLRRQVSSLCTHADLIPLSTTVASIKEKDSAECWTALMQWTIEQLGIKVTDSRFTSLGFKVYSRWIEVFGNVCPVPPDGFRDIRDWHMRLREFDVVIDLLEKRSDRPDHLAQLYIEVDPQEQIRYLNVLRCLRDQLKSDYAQVLLCAVVAIGFRPHKSAARLERITHNLCIVSGEIRTLLHGLLSTADVDLVAAFFNMRLRMCETNDATLTILREIVPILRPGVSVYHILPAKLIDRLGQWYQGRLEMLVTEARRLERRRAELGKRDPDAAAVIAAEFDLEQPARASQLVAKIAGSDLANHIEENSEDVVILSFPLWDPFVTDLEQLAWGLNGSETMLVFLRVDDLERFDGFCVQVTENRDQAKASEHSLFDMGRAKAPPDDFFSYGPPSRLAYVVARQIFKELKTTESSLENMYRRIQQTIHSAPSQCRICGGNQGAGLHRPTTCKATNCQLTYRRSPLDVRLEDLKMNGKVADLLLASVFAAASTGNMALLPDHPAGLRTCPDIVTVLNSLPPTAQIDVKKLSTQAELLLSWLCINYRGFLVPAITRWTVLPFKVGQQFVLVDTAPELETAYSRQYSGGSRSLMFHGTSLDRLYSVLCQGLKVLSGTALERHGAVYGHGVYLSSEPAMAMGYAGGSRNTSGAFFNSRSEYCNASVLLGVEVAGQISPRSGGVYVEKDPTRLRVLYIFIAPTGSVMPSLAQMSTVMLNTADELRATVARRPMELGGWFKR